MSHVDNLRVEMNSIADGYVEVQNSIDEGARAAEKLRERWANTGVEDPMIDEIMAEFHRYYGSIGAWAFNISAQIAGRARRL